MTQTFVRLTVNTDKPIMFLGNREKNAAIFFLLAKAPSVKA